MEALSKFNMFNKNLSILVALILLSCIASSVDARLRAMNFALETVDNDSINASAHGAACVVGLPHVLEDDDSGNMVYERIIDQQVIDQVNSVADEGGSILMTFTLRTAFSFVGAGTGKIDATVTVSVGGSVVDTVTVSSEGPSGTDETRYEIPVDASAFENGGAIVVTASGTGEAYANDCGTGNQAIASFYFRSGGKPNLATNPFR
ncbi:hypothetical protein SAMN02745866_00887 [Alteromonadaceae bacterium Bs31]|nr:hypothetical protein SAMN02745866_00887 [Alteromonadaceae bacterium Bs31]